MRIQVTASKKFGLHGLLAVIFLAGAVRAQTPISETQDPLGRNTPQESVFQFLEACHARDYSKATYYLDLRRMPASNGAKPAVLRLRCAEQRASARPDLAVRGRKE